jgi:predicted dehydrogenase
VAGFGWMGRVHTQAYTRLRHHFPDAPLAPRLVAVADPEPDRTADAADRYGFDRTYKDWRDLVDDPEVQAVSVTAPNFLHREIGVAVAEAGKHIWIEKPVGLGSADAAALAAATAATGAATTVGFNYRHVPAVEHARSLIAGGAIGSVTHARFRLFADYAAHPRTALSWRFERARGGDGVLGDLASHGVDLARYLVGEFDSLVADTAVFIPRRPIRSGAASHYAVAEGGELGQVENDDYLSCLLRGAGGARVTLEASRVSVGEQCNYGFEIHGSSGALFWDFRRMGELGVAAGDGYQNQGVTTMFAGPGHGEFGAFQPAGGIAMGYDDLKVIEADRFLRSISAGRPHGATVEDAVRSARALEAMAESARTGSWVRVTP